VATNWIKVKDSVNSNLAKLDRCVKIVPVKIIQFLIEIELEVFYLDHSVLIMIVRVTKISKWSFYSVVSYTIVYFLILLHRIIFPIIVSSTPERDRWIFLISIRISTFELVQSKILDLNLHLNRTLDTQWRFDIHMIIVPKHTLYISQPVLVMILLEETHNWLFKEHSFNRYRIRTYTCSEASLQVWTRPKSVGMSLSLNQQTVVYMLAH
jgi:hypothetical protein